MNEEGSEELILALMNIFPIVVISRVDVEVKPSNSQIGTKIFNGENTQNQPCALACRFYI